MAEDKKLPELVTKAMEGSMESDARMTEASKELANQMKIFSDSNKAFNKTSMALNQFAKSQMDSINPFKKIKAGFDKTFVGQKMTQIKEEKRLAETVGITRDELRLLKANKEVTEAQKAQADALKASLDAYGLNVNAFFDRQGKLTARVADRDEKGRFLSSQKIVDGILAAESDNSKREAGFEKTQQGLLGGISTAVDGVKSGLYDVKAGISADNKAFSESVTKGITGVFKGNKAVEAENKAEQAVVAAEQQTALESISIGIKSMGKSLLEGLKGLGEKGGMGVGMLFGIIAAPVIALVGFFKSLKAEFAFLNKVFKGNLTKPFVKAIDFIKDLGSKFSKTFSTKNVPIDKLLKPFIAMGDFFKNIGSKISGLFGKSGTFGKVFGIISKGFAPIAKFAAGFGSVLGKLFLPITIIMGIVDTVTGFMDGFEAGGLLGGVMGAIKGLFNGLIMKPLDLLKDAVSWLASKLGFENFSEMLDGFSFEEVFSGLVDGLESVLRSVGDWFNDKVDWVKSLFGFETSKEKEMREAVEKERAANQPAPPVKVGVMTKDGMQNLTEEEIREGKKAGTIKRSLANDALRRAEMEKEREGIEDVSKRPEAKPAEAREQVEGKGTESGIGAGSEINGRSASQAASAASINVVTNAPTTVNAPSSTSMNSQTMVSVSPGRSRTANQARRSKAV